MVENAFITPAYKGRQQCMDRRGYGVVLPTVLPSPSFSPSCLRAPLSAPHHPLFYIRILPLACTYQRLLTNQLPTYMLNQHLSTPPPNYCCCVMPVHDHMSSHQNEPGCTRVQQGFAGPFTFNHSFRKRIQPPAEGAINTTRLSKNAKKKKHTAVLL